MRVLDPILFAVSVLFYLALLPFVVVYLYAVTFVGVLIAGAKQPIRFTVRVANQFIAHDAITQITIQGRRRFVAIAPGELPPLRWWVR